METERNPHALQKMIRAATKMWSGVAQDDSELQPRRSSINLKPWWSQGAAEKTHAATRSGVRVDSRLVDNRWVLEGPAPPWWREPNSLRQGTPLALSDAFRVTQLLSAGDADDLEALLSVQVHRGPAARPRRRSRSRTRPPSGGRFPTTRRSTGAPTASWASRAATLGRNRHYQLVERPSLDARPAVRRERALALPAPGVVVAPEARAAGAAAPALAAAEARAVPGVGGQFPRHRRRASARGARERVDRADPVSCACRALPKRHAASYGRL